MKDNRDDQRIAMKSLRKLGTRAKDFKLEDATKWIKEKE